MDILLEIAERTKKRIALQKKIMPLHRMAGKALSPQAGAPAGMSAFRFEEALRSDDIAFICEVKKASPSKGIIADKFSCTDIAAEYEAAGAAAISVLTEPYYFMGSSLYLREIAGMTSLPLLRKDFIIDSYMIYEAKVLGADAVLLICALLDKNTLSEYIGIAHGLGLSVLAEIHTESEAETALNAGARIIGANCRDLRTFEVDISLSGRMRKMIPKDVLFVSESGVSCAGDIDLLRRSGADAVLAGEIFMRSPDKKAMMSELRGKK